MFKGRGGRGGLGFLVTFLVVVVGIDATKDADGIIAHRGLTRDDPSIVGTDRQRFVGTSSIGYSSPWERTLLLLVVVILGCTGSSADRSTRSIKDALHHGSIRRGIGRGTLVVGVVVSNDRYHLDGAVDRGAEESVMHILAVDRMPVMGESQDGTQFVRVVGETDAFDAMKGRSFTTTTVLLLVLIVLIRVVLLVGEGEEVEVGGIANGEISSVPAEIEANEIRW